MRNFKFSCATDQMNTRICTSIKILLILALCTLLNVCMRGCAGHPAVTMRTRIQCELVKGRAAVANGSIGDSGTASASSVESALAPAPTITTSFGGGGGGGGGGGTASADASPPEPSPLRFTRLVRPASTSAQFLA